MNEFTDGQLQYLCDLVIKHSDDTILCADTFLVLSDELDKREELANLDFDDDCLSCKL